MRADSIPEPRPDAKTEMERLARSIAIHGLEPPAPVTRATAEKRESAPADASLFSAADLLDPLPHGSEEYTMPNGKRLWVHPTSVDQASAVHIRALKEIRGLYPRLFELGAKAEELARQGKALTRLEGEELSAVQREAQVEATFRARVWQVVFCCKAGPELDARPVFTAESAEALRRNPGYNEAIQEICAISDRLGQGRSEAAFLKEQMADFFDGALSWLETFAGQLNGVTTENCLATAQELRQASEEFASSVSGMKQQLNL